MKNLSSHILFLFTFTYNIEIQESLVKAYENMILVDEMKQNNQIGYNFKLQNLEKNNTIEEKNLTGYSRKLRRGRRHRIPRPDSSLLQMYRRIMDPPLESTDFYMLDPSRVITRNRMQLIAVAGRAQINGYDCGLETWYRKANSKEEWKPGQCLLRDKPAWIDEEIPGQDGAYLSPEFISSDVILYSVRNHAVNRSNTCIGMVGAMGIFPNQLNWRDKGEPMICMNASEYEFERSVLDPSVFRSFDGENYLVTGRGSIIGTELDYYYMPSIDDWYYGYDTWVELARGPVDPFSESGYGWVEAAFVLPNRIQGYYYLFVNWGKCCEEIDSPYEIRVGRSQNPLGPYLDKAGVNMTEGGGTFFLGSELFFIDPGHMNAFRKGRRWAFTFHYSDKRRDGKSWIAERMLSWKNGWPIPGEIIGFYGQRERLRRKKAKADILKFRDVI